MLYQLTSKDPLHLRSMVDRMRAIGAVLHSPRYYDLIVKLFALGRERAFRKEMLAIINPVVGESLLDVGCGTGTLAIAAEEIIGPDGHVHGVDASHEMVERARKKAARANRNVIFQVALAQALPFPDGTFDIVSGTLMLHHLPRPLRKEALAEFRRVLRSTGRLLIMDFSLDRHSSSFMSRIHRHGHVKTSEIESLVCEAGFAIRQRGTLKKRDLYFVECTAS